MAAAVAPRVGLLYDERMCAHATPDGEDHPENPERLRAIWRKLAAEDVASRCVVMMAKEAEDRYIASVHSQNHIKLMRNISSKGYDSRRNKIARKFNSIYFNKGSSESAFLAAGSVIEVAEKVAAGELSSAIALVRPPGHHAEHNEAMGFCLFNNVAIAANYLLNERPDLGIKKILIVDWDVHHGNGTQKMFYSDPRVLFFSVHRFDYGSFYPAEGDASHCFIGEGAGKGYNINVPWEHGKCGDADYIAAWDHVLIPVAEAFDPDIILVSAGFDAALGDPLGGCCITPNGYSLLLTKLLGFAQGRIVMALEGGYNLRSIANSVFSCAKVLLGDKFTCNSPEMQPFESTWRVIQAVRDELKTCWPILSSKLPENVSLRSKPSQIENCAWTEERGALPEEVVEDIPQEARGLFDRPDAPHPRDLPHRGQIFDNSRLEEVWWKRVDEINQLCDPSHVLETFSRREMNRSLENMATVAEYHRQLTFLREENARLSKQAEAWSDVKFLTAALESEKLETQKLKKKVADLKVVQVLAISRNKSLEEKLNKIDAQEKSLRIEVDENTKMIEILTQRDSEMDLESLKVRLSASVAEMKRLLEVLTRSEEEMKSAKISLHDNIILFNSLLGKFGSEKVVFSEDTLTDCASKLSLQVKALEKHLANLKGELIDSIRDAVKNAVTYALAKLKADDPSQSLKAIEEDFDCSDIQAAQWMEEVEPYGCRVSEEMQFDSP